MKPGFVPFDKLSPELKAEAVAARPAWKAEEFSRFEFRIKRDGHISRGYGDHQPTQEAYLALDRLISGEDVRSKGDLSGYSTATFHFAPEKP